MASRKQPSAKEPSTKKPPFALFDNVEVGELVYERGDPSRRFVVDTKLASVVLLHQHGRDPEVTRLAQLQDEFNGSGWLREPRRYSHFMTQAEDAPIPTTMMESRQVLLERLRIAAGMSLGIHAVEALDVRQTVDHVTDQIVFRITTDFLTEKLTDRERVVTFRYPATWWQFFKAQNFPAWLKKRFPFRFAEEKTTVRFEEVALYPQLPFVCRDSGPVYFQASWGTDCEVQEPTRDYAKITVSVPAK